MVSKMLMEGFVASKIQGACTHCSTGMNRYERYEPGGWSPLV